jgi:hypothetical protein
MLAGGEYDDDGIGMGMRNASPSACTIAGVACRCTVGVVEEEEEEGGSKEEEVNDDGPSVSGVVSGNAFDVDTVRRLTSPRPIDAAMASRRAARGARPAAMDAGVGIVGVSGDEGDDMIANAAESSDDALACALGCKRTSAELAEISAGDEGDDNIDGSAVSPGPVWPSNLDKAATTGFDDGGDAGFGDDRCDAVGRERPDVRRVLLTGIPRLARLRRIREKGISGDSMPGPDLAEALVVLRIDDTGRYQFDMEADDDAVRAFPAGGGRSIVGTRRISCVSKVRASTM